MAKKLTKTKARQILHDKEVHGHALTDKQRRFFGAIAGGAKPYKAQNGIEGTMGGLTDKGFDFNPAWGGAWRDGGMLQPPMAGANQVVPMYAMGGNLPGSVGFTYARTQGAAPSEGPYAKKTLPSAQNGKKLSYSEWKKQYNLKKTPDYNLKRAWELGYIPDEKGHLPTVDNQTGEFLKAKGHPTLQLELDWYNSPEAADFRSKNIIDSSGKFFKYVPKSQNGQEMKFYQEGLDFKPKTISRNGGWLDKYSDDMPTAQGGIKLPGYAKAYLAGNQGDISSYYPSQKPVDVGPREEDKKRTFQKLRNNPRLKLYSDKELKQYAQTPRSKWPKFVKESVGEQENIEYNIVNHPDYNPNIPTSKQTDLAYDNSLRTMILRGRNKFLNSGNPVVDFANSLWTAPGSAFANMTMNAEKSYFNPDNSFLGNVGNFAMDASMLVPSIIPKAASAIDEIPAALKSTGQHLTTQTPLRNAYKLNPASGKIPMVGEKPHWLRGYSKDYTDPTKIDFSGMSKFSNPVSKSAVKKLNKLDDDWRALSQAERDNPEIYNQYREARKRLLLNSRLQNTGLGKLFNVDDVMGAGSYSEFVSPLRYSPGVVLKYSTKEPFEGATRSLFEAGKSIRDPQIGLPFHLQELGANKSVTLTPRMQGSTFGLAQLSAEPISRTAAAEMALKLRQLNKQGIYPDWQGYNFLRNPETGRVSVIDLNTIPGSGAAEAFVEGSRVGQNPATIIKQNWNLQPKPQNKFKSEIDWGKWNKEVPKPVSSVNDDINSKLNSFLKEKYPSWFLKEAPKTKLDDQLAQIEADAFLKDFPKNLDKQSLYSPVDLRVPAYGDNNMGLNPHLEGGRSMRVNSRGKGLFETKGDEFKEGYNLYDLLDATKYHLRKNKEGGVVKDDMGYWNPENWGKVVEIDSPYITMQGVDQPLIGISDTGDIQYMEPGEDYVFDGESVTEYPVAAQGVSVNKADEYPLHKLDDLFNFSNYNKPKAKNGKWLDKYK